MIADTTRQFMDTEVRPRTDELEAKDWKLLRELVRKGAELGLIGATIPEEYGGLGLDQTDRRDHRRVPRSLRLFRHDDGRAERYRAAPPRLLRHGRGEEKISAADH